MKQFSLFEKQESPDVLNYQIRACERCSLSVIRKHALVGEGNIDASIYPKSLLPGLHQSLWATGMIMKIGEMNNTPVSGVFLRFCFIVNIRKKSVSLYENQFNIDIKKWRNIL